MTKLADNNEYLFDEPLTYNPATKSLDPGAKSFFNTEYLGEGEVYEIHPAYEDKNNSAWLSGTSSYFLKQGNKYKYVLKTVDFSAYQSFEVAKQNLESGNERIDAELMTLRRLKELDPNPITELVCPEAQKETDEQKYLWLKVKWRNQGSSDPLEVKCFVKKFAPGYSLREWCRYRVYGDSKKDRSFPGLKDIRDWFQVGSAITESLRFIHRGRIVHGYLSPDNIIIGTQKTEEEIFKCKQRFKEEILFTNTEQFSLPPVKGGEGNMFLRLYDAPEKCWPSLAGEWYSPADIFSLGMVLLYLAIGDRLDTAAAKDLRVFDQIEQVKDKLGWYSIGNQGKFRERHALVKALLNALMFQENENGVQQPREIYLDGKEVLEERRREMATRLATIILNCIEPRIQHRAPTLRGVLRQMNLFAPRAATNNEIKGELSEATDKTFEFLGDLWKGDGLLHMLQEPETRFLQPKVCNGLPRPLTGVLVTRLGLFLSDCDDVGFIKKDKNLSLRITGGRETLVETMLGALSCLNRNDVCEALLTPTFWYDENMGECGRTLRMLELAILSGARVNWILVVNASRLQQPRVRDVLRHQSELSVELHRQHTLYAKLEMTADPLKYAVLHDDFYYRISREKMSHIRLPGNGAEPALTIVPNYSGDGQKLTTLRLWVNDVRNEAYTKAFNDVLKVARPLRKYQR